jgi:nucleoside-diphosphate-sugar epimerase
MRIFVAGASGVLGRQLLPLLVSRGHHVIASTKTLHKLAELSTPGVEPVVMDGLDPESVRSAVLSTHPDVVMHQMTALQGQRDIKHFDQDLAGTNRLRTEGLTYLLNAARAAHARRFIAQSYMGWPNADHKRAATEDDPRHPNPPHGMRQTLDAIRTLEDTVVGASDVAGTVLRYAPFYGPGTAVGPGGQIVDMIEHRKFPIVGTGGVWSFIHTRDAAEATALAVDGPPGLFNIADDEPADVRDWVSELASAIGAPAPRNVPVWLARPLIGATGVSLMTDSRGASNAKAKHAWQWQPTYATWRDGFRRGLTGPSL